MDLIFAQYLQNAHASLFQFWRDLKTSFLSQAIQLSFMRQNALLVAVERGLIPEEENTAIDLVSFFEL